MIDEIYALAEVRLVNLTPHEIVLLRPGSATAVAARLPSEGEARATSTRRMAGSVAIGECYAAPVSVVEFGEVVGLPWPQPSGLVHSHSAPSAAECGADLPNQSTTTIPDHVTCPVCRSRAGWPPFVTVRYIVSRIAVEAARASGRTTDDLLIPDDLVRGPGGQPIGCRGFARP